MLASWWECALPLVSKMGLLSACCFSGAFRGELLRPVRGGFLSPSPEDISFLCEGNRIPNELFYIQISIKLLRDDGRWPTSKGLSAPEETSSLWKVPRIECGRCVWKPFSSDACLGPPCALKSVSDSSAVELCKWEDMSVNTSGWFAS